MLTYIFFFGGSGIVISAPPFGDDEQAERNMAGGNQIVQRI